MARKYKSWKKYCIKKYGRWSSNIRSINNKFQKNSLYKDNDYNDTILLCANPVQSINTVSQQYTVKNIELQYWLETTGTLQNICDDFCVYIMYVPQGMNVTSSYDTEHPEYIMAYKYLGNINEDVDTGRSALYIKTRLSRRLQTGDSIILFIKYGCKTNTTNYEYLIKGKVRWWTKAN